MIFNSVISMKNSVHPNYTVTTIKCNSCNTVYTLGTTGENLKVELCANCHPFYTGKEVLVDTDNLVDKFNKKKASALAQSGKVQSKKEKNLRRKSVQPKQALTLRDMLNNIK